MKNQLQRINEYIDSLETKNLLDASKGMLVFSGSAGSRDLVKSNGGDCKNYDLDCIKSYNGGDCTNGRSFCTGSRNDGNCTSGGGSMLSDKGCSVGPIAPV